MKPLSGLGRDPRQEMQAEDVLEIVAALDVAGVAVWLDGGWAVDAALGEQTRPHDDLDLVVDLEDVERLKAVLETRGFVVVAGAPPRSFELVDPPGRQVDVHPVRSTEAGDGCYRMASGDDWIYPAAGFAGEGAVLATSVRCLTPAVQMLCHTGYEPHRASYDDVWALSRHFGLAVPAEYGRPRDTYGERA